MQWYLTQLENVGYAFIQNIITILYLSRHPNVSNFFHKYITYNIAVDTGSVFVLSAGTMYIQECDTDIKSRFLADIENRICFYIFELNLYAGLRLFLFVCGINL